MSVKIKGLDKAIANFDKRARYALAKHIVNGGSAILESSIKAVTPVDTGFLKASSQIIPVSSSNGAIATASVYNTADYGMYVEFGTRNMPAQPFMHRGAQHARPKIQRYANIEVVKAMKV